MAITQDQSIKDLFLTLQYAYSACSKAKVDTLTVDDFMGFIRKEITEESISSVEKFLKELHVRDFMLFATTNINFTNHPKLEFLTTFAELFFKDKSFSEILHVFLTVGDSAKEEAQKEKAK